MQKFPKVFTIMSAILALAFGLASCKENVDDDPTVTPQKTAGSISYATTSVEKTTADGTFTNELTKTGDGTVTYASSKETVATVNATTGEVTIAGAGTTTITATVADSDTYTYETKTASYTLTVTAADTTPQKTAGSISYAVTSVEKTTADGAFTNVLTTTGDGTVTYASSKTDVAEVTQTGLVTIKGAGETTITATVADSDTYTYETKSASYTLTVTAADITPQKTAGSISYAVTSVEKTTADGAFTNVLTTTGDGTVTYTSSKTDIAEVNTQTGLVTIKGAGTTTITATVADSESYTYATKTASYTLTVTQATTPTTYIGTKAPTEAKAVGDIVFSDGSATPYSEDLTLTEEDLTLTEEQKSKAVAVIFYAGSASDTLGAKTLGVGLKNSVTDSTFLAWAKNGVNGYSTNITAIQCTPSESGIGRTAKATFKGDTDGSDNWQALCDAVSDEETSGNYPAWEWVNAYATTANLTDDYASGWYLPTVAELSMLYRAKDTVNASIEAAGGTEIADADYWSSSQAASNNSSAWTVYFDPDYLNTSSKDNGILVCAVRAF
ncbi:uncharacterized protein YjdB [Treponema rectale]|nr:Ig-like domain-containing protein [Treponema rectale]MBB5218065.1 uncharacterized protein YjdB [Treponema rectale]